MSCDKIGEVVVDEAVGSGSGGWRGDCDDWDGHLSLYNSEVS